MCPPKYRKFLWSTGPSAIPSRSSPEHDVLSKFIDVAWCLFEVIPILSRLNFVRRPNTWPALRRSRQPLRIYFLQHWFNLSATTSTRVAELLVRESAVLGRIRDAIAVTVAFDSPVEDVSDPQSRKVGVGHRFEAQLMRGAPSHSAGHLRGGA